MTQIDHDDHNDYYDQMASWPLAKAKAKLSELVEHAVHHEPQEITRNGKPVVVVLSISEWKDRLAGHQPRQNLAEFFRTSPLAGSDIDLRRTKDRGRPVEL